MNTEKPLIRLYRTRTFGEKMADTFDFVRENWRPMLKYFTYLLLPLALVQNFVSDSFMTGYDALFSGLDRGDIGAVMSWLVSTGVMLLFYFVATLLATALTYTMMQLYEQRPERLAGITFADLRPGVMRMAVRQLVLWGTGIIIIAVMGVVLFLTTMVSRALLPVVVLLLICLLPLFVLVSPIYLFENTGVVKAYMKSFRLGWKTWAGIVAVCLVLYLLLAIVQGVVSGPFYVMVALKGIFSTQNAEPAFASSFGYTALQYVLGVVSVFCGSCIETVLLLGVAYQYGHACDKEDGVTVDRDIENFETLNTAER